MKENVGKLDQTFRCVAGPSLIMLGYAQLGGKEGRPLGLLSMMAGAMVIESAISRVCPVNALLGIDSRATEEVVRDKEKEFEPAFDELYI